MSELDLGLKVETRKLLWGMGYSTRLDVELRASRSTQDLDGRRSGFETFTDLDVLGITVNPGFRLSKALADCKSGKRDKPVARMFWAKGVGELVKADQIILVRQHEVIDATRQLSDKLGISVLTAQDMSPMQDLYNLDPHMLSGPLRILFDKEKVERHNKAFDQLDKKMAHLIQYRQFDYWVIDPHRNLTQLVAHLTESRKILTSENPIHLALFLDLAWMFLLSLIELCEHVQRAYSREPDRAIQEYLFGGPENLLEKQQIAEVFSRYDPLARGNVDHLPKYYNEFRELVSRLIRRPSKVLRSLRYIEAAIALKIERDPATLAEAFGRPYDPIASKLVVDICKFLLKASGVDANFGVEIRRIFLDSEPDLSISALESH